MDLVSKFHRGWQSEDRASAQGLHRLSTKQTNGVPPGVGNSFHCHVCSILSLFFFCFCFFWGDPSSGWNYCHFRCGKPEAEGARGLPLLLPSIGQEACMVLWPLIWSFDGVSVPRSFWIWWMPICPKGPEVRPCGVDEEQTRVTRGISFWNLCHPFPSSMPSPDFSEHHTYMANCLLGISMWMSERHLKFNIQKWNLGLSTLHPLPNLLFPSVFP